MVRMARWQEEEEKEGVLLKDKAEEEEAWKYRPQEVCRTNRKHLGVE